MLESIYEEMFHGDILEEKLILRKKTFEDGNSIFIVDSDTGKSGETFAKKDKIAKSGLFTFDKMNLRKWVSKKKFTPDEFAQEVPKYKAFVDSLNPKVAGTPSPEGQDGGDSFAEKEDQIEELIEQGAEDKIKNYLADLIKKIEIDANSPEVRAFLDFSKKFRKYSFYNRLLIHIQKPNATRIASAKKWRDQLGRSIKKGEKAIMIYAPIRVKDKNQPEPDPNQPATPADDETRYLRRFKLVPVFDISQTEAIAGQEHLTPEEPKWWDDTQPDEKTEIIYDALIDLAKKEGIEVTVSAEGLGKARGVSSVGKIQLLQKNISTLIHEIAHELIHDVNTRMSPWITKDILEAEAEGVAYVVSHEFDLPTEHVAKYMALWKINQKHLKDSEKTISDTANNIIDYINKFAANKEEGIEDNGPHTSIKDVNYTDDEVSEESFKGFFMRRTILENEQKPATYKVKDRDKRIIGKALAEVGLDGNGRFGNPSKGVSALAAALHKVGFELDMVSGDLLLGDNGQRNLSYRKYSDSTGTFDEHPEVTNSRIAFNWHLQGRDHDGYTTFEIQCYPS